MRGQAPSSALYEYNFPYSPLSLTQFFPIGGTRITTPWYAEGRLLVRDVVCEL